MGIGIALGLLGAVSESGSLHAAVRRVDLNPSPYVGVIVLLGGVSMIACGVPAWRAARTIRWSR